MTKLAETDNNRTVDLPAGEALQITLPENATTGFRWAIDKYDSEILEALGSEPHYAGKAIGSGGEVTFAFRGKKAGSGEIALKQWRQWEGDSSIVSRFRVRVNIRP